MASINFDAETVEPSASFEALPPGVYEAVITESVSKAMKSGNGMGFTFTFEVISGEYAGRKVFVWITFEHRTSPDAQRIGQGELSAICRAVGVTRLTDTAQLHNLPLLITVGKDRHDPTRNIVTAYKAKSAPATTSAPQRTQTAAPAAQTAAPWARR